MIRTALRNRFLTAKAGLRRARIAAHRLAGDNYARRGVKRDPDARPARPGADPLTKWFQGHNSGAGIMKPLGYFEVYHRHLAKYVGRPVHVVEIGVYSGGSLGMWQHYFGPECHIYGVDIENECRRHQRDNVDIFIGDQADPAFWTEFRQQVPTVDIVIDDGGHLTHQQIVTLEALLPHIQNGGVYICEDVAGRDSGFHAYIEGMSRNIHATGDRTTGFQQTVSSLHLYPYMVVIEKPEYPLSEFIDETHGSEWASFAPGVYDPIGDATSSGDSSE